MNCSIQDIIVTLTTTYSPKQTTAEIHWLTIRLRVQFVTCQVVQQPWWFQQEHSVRTAGPRRLSTQDIWFQIILETSVRLTAAVTFAGTRHRKSQLAEQHKTKQWSTLLKSSVGHCHVPCTSAEGSWRVSFALNDEFYARTVMRNLLVFLPRLRTCKCRL